MYHTTTLTQVFAKNKVSVCKSCQNILFSNSFESSVESKIIITIFFFKSELGSRELRPVAVLQENAVNVRKMLGEDKRQRLKLLYLFIWQILICLTKQILEHSVAVFNKLLHQHNTKKRKLKLKIRLMHNQEASFEYIYCQTSLEISFISRGVMRPMGTLTMTVSFTSRNTQQRWYHYPLSQ